MLSKALTCVLAFAAIASTAPAPQCNQITSTEAARVKQAFINGKIIPDVVPSFEPTVRIDAAHGQKKIDLGNSIQTLETLTEPTFTFTAEPGYDPSTTKYFKFILDPDAPGPDGTIQSPLQTLVSDFLHLAEQNAAPDCISPDTKEVVRMYLSPTPLSVANHRYIFLVYRQPAGFKAPLSLRLTIQGLKLQEFVDQYGLELVGGNYYVQGLGTSLGGVGAGGPI